MRTLMGMVWAASLVAQGNLGPHLRPVTWGELPHQALTVDQEAVESLSRSLRWLETPSARRAYEAWGGEQIRLQVGRSLLALRRLAQEGLSPEGFREALAERFVPYQLGTGGMHLTGYCEAWAEGSLVRTSEFSYPLFRRPKDFSRWSRPHPTREELEGSDGRGSRRLRGCELVWLRNRMDAYLFHVQGSGRVKLVDGGEKVLGFSGRTDQPFSAVGALVAEAYRREGKVLPPEGVYALLRENARLAQRFLPQNRRFVFFQDMPAGPPKGAYGMGLTPDHSFAADPACVPPGAPALLFGTFGERLACNQDRGGAIRGPHRLDLYEGGGPEAMGRAGAINGPGSAFILLLRDEKPIPAPGDVN